MDHRHMYVIRFEGDEAYEHHLGLIADTELPPLHTLPPIYIYPHGIEQVRVRFEQVDHLPPIQHDQWETINKFQEKVWQRLLSGHSPAILTSTAPTFDNKGFKSFAQDLQRALAATHTFLLVPCTNPTRVTETNETSPSRPRVDEHDELFLHDDDLVRDKLVLQSLHRLKDLELTDLPPVETVLQPQYRIDSEMASTAHEQPPPPLDHSASLTSPPQAEIAWDYIDEFMKECNFHANILPIIAGYISSSPVDFYDSISIHEVLKTLGAPNSEREFVLETIYNGQLYLFVTISNSKSAHSPFPNKEFSSYLHYYQQKWPNFAVSHPDLPLIRVANFQPGPLNVLVPSVLGERKKSTLAKQEDEEETSSMYLLPDLVRVWRISSRFYQLLRMAPSILYRLDMDLRHQAFANDLQVQFNPSALRMALTTGNAQENYALKPLLPQPPPMPHTVSLAGGMQFVPALTAYGATHAQMYASFPQQIVHSYERLKFVGDSLMKLLLSQYFLAIADPDDDELSLTKKKSDCLSHLKLSMIAHQQNIHHVLISEPFQPVEYAKKQLMGARWSDTANLSPSNSYTSASLSFFSSEANKNILADCVSSLMAAAWLSDGGRLSCMNLLLRLGIIDPTRLMMHKLFDRNEPLHVEIDRLIQLQLLHLSVPEERRRFPLSESMQTLLASRSEFESRIGYKFNEDSLFLRAFVHDSWQHRDRVSLPMNIFDPSPGYPHARVAPFPTMQRLEFLGDAVLDVCISTYLFHSFPFCNLNASGDLTALRQRMVNNCLFAEICAEHGFHHLLLQSSDETRTNIDRYVSLGESTMEYMRGHGYNGPWYLARVRGIARTTLSNPPKILADLLEAIFGAVFVDSCFSFSKVWQVFTSLTFIDVDWERHTYDETYMKHTLQIYAKRNQPNSSFSFPDGKKHLPHWDKLSESTK